MKYIIGMLFTLISCTAFAQADEIYRLAFSDTSNFSILTAFEQARPKLLRIADSTEAWGARRFWLEGVDLSTPAALKLLARDEHHPYNFAYLFKDSLLNARFGDAEKQDLAKRAVAIPIQKLQLSGPGYTTVPSVKKLKGFYFISTSPVFSADGRYAFIDISIIQKEKVNSDVNQSYFGNVCIVYELQPGGGWKKLKVKPHLIL